MMYDVSILCCKMRSHVKSLHGNWEVHVKLLPERLRIPRNLDCNVDVTSLPSWLSPGVNGPLEMSSLNSNTTISDLKS